MRKSVAWTVIALILCVAGPVMADEPTPSITVGEIHLQPNTPNQVVELYVTGGTTVQGITLYLLVANGGPEFEELDLLAPGEGILGPAITSVDIITDTIFANNNIGQIDALDGFGLLQAAILETVTASDTVSAEGLLARITFDTTGFAEGTFALSLSMDGEHSDFGGIPINLTDGVIIIDEAPPANLPPVVNAGADFQVASGAFVELAGTASDPESAPLTYLWQQTDGTPVVLGNAATATAGFTAPASAVNTDLTFQLTVSDGTNVQSDTVVVTVAPSVLSFSVYAGPDQTVAGNAFVSLVGVVDAPNGQSLTLLWTQINGPQVILNGATTVSAGFQAPAVVVNTILTFQFEASDGTTQAMDTVNIEVNPSTTGPVADAGPDQNADAGATVQLDGMATDPANAGLTYAWVQTSGPAVILSNAAIAGPTFVAPSLPTPSDLVFEFRATASAMISVDTVTIHVAATQPYVNPLIPTDGSSLGGGYGTDNDSDTNETDQSAQTDNKTATNNESSSSSTTSFLAVLAMVLLAFFLLFFLWL